GMPKWYLLSVNNPASGTALDVSNKFHETGLFANIDPAFMFNLLVEPATNPVTPPTSSPVCSNTNDAMFSQQWGLYNAAYPNYDINACEAWTISQGAGVKVAVIDSGIQTNHTDLATNMASYSYDSFTPTIPSKVYTYHGTYVAGIIAAKRNNDEGTVGVAPQAKLVSISNPLSAPIDNENGNDDPGIDPIDPLNPNQSETTFPHQMTNAFAWAAGNLPSGEYRSDIINNSWGLLGGPDYSDTYSAILEGTIISAIESGRNGKGCIIVFASGNGGGAVSYPGNIDERILTVGAITDHGMRPDFSGRGEFLDVVAPGDGIESTVYTSTSLYPNVPLQNEIINKSGTSFAAPHASGIAALMLSVNPCLSGQQVRDIIEGTSQKINTTAYEFSTDAIHTNGTWNNNIGYGLVDAYAAVQAAQQMNSATLDLYIKDSFNDFGIEPNTITEHMWASEDIWIRNVDDGEFEHQNPAYKANGAPNFIYVRVINKSCVASTGNETLTINWAKASTSLNWPTDWNGSQYFNTYPLSGVLPGITIPVLQPGQETIVKVPWVVPNPANYVIAGTDQWHFCLLARVDAVNDPINVPLPSNPGQIASENNNIAWKNVTVVILPMGGKLGGKIAVRNPANAVKTYKLTFITDTNETGTKIFEEAEVRIILDNELFHIWDNGGKKGKNIHYEGGTTIRITGEGAALTDLTFTALQVASLNLEFSFLTEELSDKQNFVYHVLQDEPATGTIIGGETYKINKLPRPLFIANAGNNKMANINELVTISAEEIDEPALYNWYDSEGNLIYEGADFTVSVTVAAQYRLEIIALADGYKDYSEVNVALNPNAIETVSPNPSSDVVTVTYNINQGTSAYLAVTGFYGSNVSNNYILDVTQNSVTLDVSLYPQGLYTVTLISDGQVSGSTTLIKE
ncbi:MAG: S8 family serine peptidase, partial [Bacteroidota bacterium]